MARRKKTVTKPKPKAGRKAKVRRKSYSLEVKKQARDWHFNDGMGPSAVKKKWETMRGSN